MKECPDCSGTGRNALDSSDLPIEDVMHSMYACPTCEGYGEIVND
jgi:DnaJ-class molecular chaperone